MVIKYDAFRERWFVGCCCEKATWWIGKQAFTTTTTITFSNWFWCGWLNWCYDSGWLINISISLNLFILNTLHAHMVYTQTVFRTRLLYFCVSIAAFVVGAFYAVFFIRIRVFCVNSMIRQLNRFHSANMVKSSQLVKEIKEERRRRESEYIHNWCEAIRKP